MSFWDDLRWYLGGGVQNASPTVPAALINAGSDVYSSLTGNLTLPGELAPLSERAAMMVPAIYACTNLIAGAISALPVEIYNRDSAGELEQTYGDPLWWILNEEFCPRWVASVGWEFLVLSKLLHGDAFAEIKRVGARVTGLVPLHPLRVTVVPWTDGTRLAYIVQPDPWAQDRTIRTLDQDDVLHIPGMGFDGCRSMSPLRNSLRSVGAVAKATQDYSGQFFKNMARPDYALVMPGKPSEEQVAALRAAIDAKHGHGAGNSGRPMLLSGGMDIKTITLTNKDAELIASTGLQIEQIASVYGVPPFMIGHNEKTTSWGSGVGEMGTNFVRYTLGQHLNAFSNEINRKLFKTAAKVAAFDTFQLESSDMTQLFQSFRIAIGRAGEPGFMSVEEVRNKLKLKRKPANGDTMNNGGNGNAPVAEQPAAA